MSNQYSMKIYPAGRGHEVYRNIEICGSSTLNQLGQVILESFDFIDEHLYFGYHEGDRSEQIFGTFLFTIYEGHI